MTDKNKFETKNIGIFNNDEKFIFLKVNDKIIVYSIELEIPIATLDINNDTQLYNFMNHSVIECDDDDKITYKLSNVHLYMDTVSTLFQNAKCESGKKLITESIKNLIKWEIYAEDDKIKLEVFKKINTKWELISTRIEIYPYRSKYVKITNLFI
ncbi:hypothetical protein GLOIN_2v75200 [Rhizophagus irregularis DAOM 181602=DAOM 197198]|nr:hypothetical protein GLOIN_2v75200 [Rhizophagus irregularis DAOM 181602=DAOM 197198]